MQFIKNLRGYLLEDEFQIRILNGRINIVNYNSIEHFDNNKVIVKQECGIIVITGDHLVVSKLLTDEILVTGTVKNIELR